MRCRAHDPNQPTGTKSCDPSCNLRSASSKSHGVLKVLLLPVLTDHPLQGERYRLAGGDQGLENKGVWHLLFQGHMLSNREFPVLELRFAVCAVIGLLYC